MIVQNCVTGPYPVMYPGGALALENILIAATAMVNFERRSGPRSGPCCGCSAGSAAPPGHSR